MEAGGVSSPDHRNVWLWPWATWALGFTVADPRCREGGGGRKAGSQRVLELVDRIVSAQALAGQGAGGVTGLSVVKEAVERGLLEAGVEGWHYCRRRIGIPKATEPSRGSTLEGLQLRLRTAKIW